MSTEDSCTLGTPSSEKDEDGAGCASVAVEENALREDDIGSGLADAKVVNRRVVGTALDVAEAVVAGAITTVGAAVKLGRAAEEAEEAKPVTG